MPDEDLKRFARGLNQTRAGLRLRLAIHESRIAIAQIRRLKHLGPRSARAIESWRRAYIQASDSAAQAIDSLWDEHEWPADGARDRSFEWKIPVRR